MNSRIEKFSEEHDLSRWNLQDPDDAWKLWYSLTILEARLFELYFLQSRKHQYAKSHMTFGEYWGIKAIRNVIMPYRESKVDWISLMLNRTEREIDELEEKE